MSRSTSTTITSVLAVVAAVVVVVAMAGGNHEQLQQVEAFAPPAPVTSQRAAGRGMDIKTLKMGFFSDEEPKKLTRESEPDEFFATYV